jgi:hypothetical protein
MDHAEAWKRFLSECPEIAGGAYFRMDGERISTANFGDGEASCAAARIKTARSANSSFSMYNNK